MVSDAILLQRYARSRDAEAFAELVQRYAGLVYGTCLRVLRNADDAEDVAQECFLELARKAGIITTSLPGWLHALARSRAIDTMRKASVRRHYEEQAMTEEHEEDVPTWTQIAPYIDEALAALPEEVRLPLLLHFFEGRTQAQVAKALGVNQSTVSRRIEKGLAELREHLREAGVLLSLAVLAALLTAHAATAAPATLLTALNKMALAGVGGTPAGTTVATSLISQVTPTLTGKLLLCVVGVTVIIGSTIFVQQVLRDKAQPRRPAIANVASIAAVSMRTAQLPAVSASIPALSAIMPVPRPVIDGTATIAKTPKRAVVDPPAMRISDSPMATDHSATTTPRKEPPMENESTPATARPATDVPPEKPVTGDMTHLSEKLVQLAGRHFAEGLPEKNVLFAGVPMAYTQALNAAGVRISYTEFTALTGWAFSFGYNYDDLSSAFMALRGQPGGNGPYEVFQALPEQLGFTRELAAVKNDETFWTFIRTHIDADIPVLSEHMDGGLICGYRQQAGVREVWFVGGPLNGWVRVDKLQPFEVCALRAAHPAVARRQLQCQALARAVALANRQEWDHAPQGLAALTTYLQDIGDEKKDFAKCAEWFCWAAFERLSARKCCAVWLRSAAEEIGGPARAPLLAAAQHYDNAFTAYDHFRLATADNGKGGVRNPEKIAEIVPIMKQGIDEERAGVAEIARALPLIPAEPATAGKAKIIDGVATLGWGRDKECTFAGALESALAAVKTPSSYSDLMGASALAFRVRWYEGRLGQRWCPSSPVGEFPEEIAALRKATGWTLQSTFFPVVEQAQMARFVPQIVAAIDAGSPVLAYPPNMNMGVIYGYEDDGNTLLLRDYDKAETPLRLPAAQLGPMVIFLGEHGPAFSRHTALHNALRQAMQNWRRPPEPRDDTPGKSGVYQYGHSALTAWADDLALADTLTTGERELLFMVNWWNFESLYDARLTAVSYLESHADALNGPGRTALQRAVELYRQEYGILGPVFTDHNVFFGPWSGKSIKDWTPEVRQRERALLQQADAIETAAIAELEKAVAADPVDK